MVSRVPIAFGKLFQKYVVNLGSLSDTMDTDTPCGRTISRIYNRKNLSNVKVIRTAIKCANFVSWSTITHIASCPCGVHGKWVIKSIVMCSHFHLATSNGRSSPADIVEQSPLRVEVAIGRAGPGWAGPTVGRAKIGPVFSGQNFNSPSRPKNRADRAK